MLICLLEVFANDLLKSGVPPF